MLPEFDLNDKVVLVTGAGRGIGRGIAEVLAEAGADIALNALTDNNVTGTASKIAAVTGRKVIPFAGDVTNMDGANHLIEQVLSEFGQIDILINNLGDAIGQSLVDLKDDTFTPIDEAALKQTIDINMTGTLLCTRAVGPHMLQKKQGKVINISSYTAGRAGGNVVLYSAAKAAVVGFTRAQALEWAPYNIQVNSIAPGLFPEPMVLSEERLEQMARWASKSIPLGRTGELREVGYLALYLASPASNYMTGQTLYLDGGLSL